MLKRTLRALVAKTGFEIRRTNRYIPAKQTVAAATRAGLSVCDYLERKWALVGATQRIVDRMEQAGALTRGMSVVEIGAGTGRYAEKLIERCAPTNYLSYETATDWAEWLARTYPITSMPTDGSTLAGTPDRSADLVHAHGVFVYTPFLVSVRYWEEVCRVLKPGGFAVFDLLADSCFTEEFTAKWLASGEVLPCTCSRAWVLDFFKRRGLALVDSFTSPYGPGVSEYLVLRNGLAVGTGSG